MAKHISHFSPGNQDYQATNDWCEFMALDQTCSPASHRDAQYGNACNRFCMPTGFGMNNDRKKCNREARVVKYGIKSGGGGAWGSCCCMWGDPAGGGAYIQGCLPSVPGEVYCYVVAMGACCTPADHTYGCFSGLWSPTHFNCGTCVMGGYCGSSSCYYSYCCQDQTNNADYNKVYLGGTAYDSADIHNATTGRTLTSCAGTHAILRHAGHTIYKANCVCGTYRPGMTNSTGTCVRGMGYEIGLQPSWRGLSDPVDDWNHIPYGGHCFPHWHNRASDKPNRENKTTAGFQCNYQRNFKAHTSNHQSHACSTGCCSAEGECVMRLCSMYVFHRGFTITDCHYGCSDWDCNTRPYSNSGEGEFNRGTGHATTGPNWRHFPYINASRACGGFNWTGWYQCAWGMGDGGHCEYGPHFDGIGGVPANVCGGPCCCGGPPVRGHVILKYRNTNEAASGREL